MDADFDSANIDEGDSFNIIKYNKIILRWKSN